MEINTIERLPGDAIPSKEKGVRENTQPEPPSHSKQDTEKTEPSRPSASRRPAALMNTITRSLNQAGIETPPTTATQGTEATQDAQTKNNPESSQNEKVAQALQAFMHSLVQAMNTRKENAGETPASDSSSSSASHGANFENPAPTPNVAHAYGGLVSRLEGLVQELEGNQGSVNKNNGLNELNGAFDKLASAVADNGSSHQSRIPELQAVLQNMIRNLQSTGDPTLASTGNIINTAA